MCMCLCVCEACVHVFVCVCVCVCVWMCEVCEPTGMITSSLLSPPLFTALATRSRSVNTNTRHVSLPSEPLNRIVSW